jgi:predicted RNA-binding Zn-ribbon protein involved in translation (DUF1610 family)
MSTALFILIVVLALVLLIVRRPLIAFFRGKEGEVSVRIWLKLLPSDQYKVINDLLISSHGHTSQIDHVVVSEYGIFVIETKNYQGWIYGGNYSEYWTQNIFGKKYELRNPILQNQGHVRALKRLLPDVSPDTFIPIVAFSRRATLKLSTNEPVVYWSSLIREIRSHKTRHLTPEMVQQVYTLLLSSNQVSKEKRKQHVKNVKTTITRNQNAVANNRCPRCGSKLVLRDGKYGKFYGCNNYPNCRYTHQA